MATRPRSRRARKNTTASVAVKPRPVARTRLVSKLTARSQTTVPNGVRRALGLQAGDQIAYRIEGERAIMERAIDIPPADAALAEFLELLLADLRTHPERYERVPAELLARARTLTAGILIDHDAPIEGEIEL